MTKGVDLMRESSSFAISQSIALSMFPTFMFFCSFDSRQLSELDSCRMLEDKILLIERMGERVRQVSTQFATKRISVDGIISGDALAWRDCSIF